MQAPQHGDEQSVVFTHKGRACKVRRSFKRVRSEHAAIRRVYQSSLWQRWLTGLLPRLGLSAIV